MSKSAQKNSMVVPVILLVLIIVIALLWWVGIIGTGSSSNTDANRASAVPEQPAETSAPQSLTPEQQEPVRELSAGEIAAQKVKAFKPQVKRSANGTGFELVPEAAAPEDEGVRGAAEALIASHQPDFSVCSGEADPQKVLDCAAGEQNKALNAAFAAHNELRAKGDTISIQRGGQIMQLVIERMQASLEPYVNAANSSYGSGTPDAGNR